MKKEFRGELVFTMNATNKDFKYCNDINHVFTFVDLFEFDTEKDDLECYHLIKNELILIANGGYDTSLKHINIKSFKVDMI